MAGGGEVPPDEGERQLQPPPRGVLGSHPVCLKARYQRAPAQEVPWSRSYAPKPRVPSDDALNHEALGDLSVSLEAPGGAEEPQQRVSRPIRQLLVVIDPAADIFRACLCLDDVDELDGRPEQVQIEG